MTARTPLELANALRRENGLPPLHAKQPQRVLLSNGRMITRKPKTKSARQIEQEKLTPERILQIIRSKGDFRVSWRYRDEWLIRRCEKMRRAGLIRRLRGVTGENLYVLSEKNRAQSPAPCIEGAAV